MWVYISLLIICVILLIVVLIFRFLSTNYKFDVEDYVRYLVEDCGMNAYIVTDEKIVSTVPTEIELRNDCKNFIEFEVVKYHFVIYCDGIYVATYIVMDKNGLIYFVDYFTGADGVIKWELGSLGG